MTELGIKAAAAAAKADLDRASTKATLAQQAKTYAEANRINTLLNPEMMNIQAKTALTYGELGTTKAKRELITSENEGQKYKNNILQLDGGLKNASYQNDLKRIKAYSDFERKNAQDLNALYDNYADYYGHKPGNKSTASKFERKFGWYYSPYLGDAAKREMMWKGWQTDTALNTINTAGGLIGNVGKGIGGITKAFGLGKKVN